MNKKELNVARAKARRIGTKLSKWTAAREPMVLATLKTDASRALGLQQGELESFLEEVGSKIQHAEHGEEIRITLPRTTQ